MSEQVTDLQAAYNAYRRRWAEEVAQVIPTATPWPKRPTGLYAWRIRPEPGTHEDGDPQD